MSIKVTKGDYSNEICQKIQPTDNNLSHELLAKRWKKLKEPSGLGVATLFLY